MSAEPSKKSRWIANLVILVLLLVVAAGLARRYVFVKPPAKIAADAPRTEPRPPERNLLSVGDEVKLTGVSWAKNRKTMLLVFSPDCHFCNESLPFYQKLTAEAAKHKNVHIIGVSPEGEEESKKFLLDHTVSVEDVKRSPLKSIGLVATPTLVLVDEAGVATDILMGQLPPDAEAKVMKWLKGSAATKPHR
jgi:thioredoxin-related protein